ncbi:sigma factor [Candidatus Amarobacter glycogenicus]|uniref:sigma factor n=1 Tax=Candidatus Amarobacter glycogenicus TaxID=3140699 RepID=UPI0031CC8815
MQETWLAVLQGIQRFEGRSSLKTWLFRILMNRAQTRGQREGRTIPFSALAPDSAVVIDEPWADRFLSATHPVARPLDAAARSWRGIPEELYLSAGNTLHCCRPSNNCLLSGVR